MTTTDPQRLSNQVCLSPFSATNALTRAYRPLLGLLQRTHSRTSERARIILLTEQGTALKAQADSVPHELACQSGLSEAEGHQLKQLTEKLFSHLRGEQP